MKLTKHRHDTIAAMNMTPMIDIVFLLIIFFMTVSQVSKVNNERIPLPKQAGSEEQPTSSLTVNVRRSGEIVVSGRVVNVPELVSLVADDLARVGNDPSRLNVVVRCDLRGSSEAVNDIVDALAKIQVQRVRIAVEVPR